MDKHTITHLNKNISLHTPESTGNVAKTIAKKRFYEQKFLDYIKKQNLCGVYLDVGANIGNHSVYFAKFTPAEKVISLELVPNNYAILKKNINSNKLSKKVIVLNNAAGSKKGLVSFKINPKDELGGAKVIAGKDIEQITLDEYVGENIVAIKIDVEGAEKDVLVGAKKY